MDATVDLAERIYATVVDDDPSPFLSLCAADAVISYPATGLLPYGGSWQGREGIAAFLEAHDSAEEILVFEPTEMVPNGDTVVVIGRFEGRAKPGGDVWSTRFVHLLTFEVGLLQRWEALFDTAAAIEARAR